MGNKIILQIHESDVQCILAGCGPTPRLGGYFNSQHTVPNRLHGKVSAQLYRNKAYSLARRSGARGQYLDIIGNECALFSE